jgi:hypothetical protein
MSPVRLPSSQTDTGTGWKSKYINSCLARINYEIYYGADLLEMFGKQSSKAKLAKYVHH